MSRRRTVKPRKRHPRLLGFVDGWVLGLLGKAEKGREAMQVSELEGEELKTVRKRVWRERKEQKARAKEREAKAENIEAKNIDGTKDMEIEEEMEMGQEVYDSDFEHEIIDHYAALTSTPPLPPMKASAAQVPVLTTDPSAQILSSHIEVETLDPNRMSGPQASSKYSIHQASAASTYEPPRRGRAWHGQESAGKQAAEYRSLLTPPPEEPLSRLESIKKEGERRQLKEHRPLITPPPEEPWPKSKTVKKEEKRRQTTWSQFCE